MPDADKALKTTPPPQKKKKNKQTKKKTSGENSLWFKSFGD